MEKTTDNGTIKLYELGFHILPSVPAPEVADKVSKIDKVLESHSAKVISRGEPKLINLAYEMRKDVGGKYQKCREAYFGWVKFEAETEEINNISKQIDALDFVLRYIIINTVVDGDHTTNKLAQEELTKSDKKPEQVEVSEQPSVVEQVVEVEKKSSIDEAIDALVE